MRILRKVSKIILVFLLVGALTVSSAENARATGAEGVVEIVGGSIAAGGIGAALSTICPPAMIIVGLIMIGQGIDIALTDASQAEGMTKTQFLQSKFEEFCDYAEKDFERTCNTIVSGAKILADGTIWLADEAGEAISQFINNMIATDNIIPESELASGSTNIGNVQCPVIYQGESSNLFNAGGTYSITNNSPNEITIFACSITHNGYTAYRQIVALNNKQTFSYTVKYNGSDRGTYNGSGTTYKDYNYRTIIDYDVSHTLLVPYVGDLYSAIDSLSGSIGGSELTEDSLVSTKEIDTTILNPSQGKDVVINTGIDLQGISSAYGDAGTISIDNYLDTLRQAINGVTDLTIAVQNVATGVIDNVDVGVYNPTDVAVSNESEEEAENQIATPVIDVNEYPSGEAAEQALTGMQFDLTRIFPFCIPFDLVHLVQKFDVTPVAPHVQISVPLPGVGTNFELDIDLSDFDGVARVARMMELIASIVGLAMVTRGLIRG